MSDLTLRTTTRAQVALRVLPAELAAGVGRVADRFRREQTGQDLVEYGGILILVAAIIAALISLKIPSDISQFVGSAVNNIVGSSASGNASG